MKTPTLPIPDDLANRLSAEGGDLSRRALEAFALEEYKSERISTSDCGACWVSKPGTKLDGFLKAHEVWAKNTIEDLHREMQDLKSLGR